MNYSVVSIFVWLQADEISQAKYIGTIGLYLLLKIKVLVSVITNEKLEELLPR